MSDSASCRSLTGTSGSLRLLMNTSARAYRIAYAKATQAVREVFGTNRKRAGLNYAICVQELSDKNDKAANPPAIWRAHFSSPPQALHYLRMPFRRDARGQRSPLGSRDLVDRKSSPECERTIGRGESRGIPIVAANLISA